MKRINLLYEMDGLLKVCKTCNRPGSKSMNPEIRCKGCNVYQQLRKIGDQLEGKQVAKGIKITVNEFVQLNHVEGKSHREIAELKGVNEASISNWKWRKKEDIQKAIEALKNAPETTEKPIEGVSARAENESELHALKNELNERDEKIKSLENEATRWANLAVYLQGEVDKRPDVRKKEIDDLKQQIEYLKAELAPLRQLTYIKLKQDIES